MKLKKIKSLFLYIISISLIVVMINFNHYTTIYAQDNQIEEAEYTNAKNNFDHIQSEVLKNQQNLEVLELNIRKFQEELVDVLNSENKISAEEKVEITKQEQANATTILEAKTIKQAETSSQLEISSTLLKKTTTTKQANDEIYNRTTVAKTQVAEDEAKTNLDTATVDLNRKAQNLEILKTKTVASEQDVNNKTQALNLLRQDESAKLNEL